MKAVFAIDGQGQLSEIGEMLQLAIASCQRNTSLQPVVLANSFVPSYRDWLEKRGVECHVIDTPMASAIMKANQEAGYPLQAIGNYLRYEACSIIDDEAILYLDCDVIFLRDPMLPSKPALFAAGPEDFVDDFSRVNSGVLLINVPEMRRHIQDFYEFARNNLVRLYPGYDQPAVNEYFRGRIDRLPLELNWRPYWGQRANVSIVHFHGMKANFAAQLLDGIYGGHEDCKDLVIRIISKTLENLHFFVRQLGHWDWDDLPYFIRLQQLVERIDQIKRDPVECLCRSAVRVRDEMSEEVLDARRQVHRIAAQAFGKSALRSCVIEIGDATGVRFVIHEFDGLFGFGNLEDEAGNTIARFGNATRSGIRTIDMIGIEGKEISTIAPNATARYVDVIFHVPRIAPGTLREVRIWLWAAGNMEMKGYLSRGEAFTEDWVFYCKAI